MKSELYATLASLVDARIRCQQTGNDEWLTNHTERILSLVDEMMPSGSGLDCGTKIDLDDSTPEKLVFDLSYHHMNDGGMYDGWTEHRAIVTPSLAFGFNLKITGPNRNDIKEYLHESYSFALQQSVEQHANA